MIHLKMYAFRKNVFFDYISLIRIIYLHLVLLQDAFLTADILTCGYGEAAQLMLVS